MLVSPRLCVVLGTVALLFAAASASFGDSEGNVQVLSEEPVGSLVNELADTDYKMDVALQEPNCAKTATVSIAFVIHAEGNCSQLETQLETLSVLQKSHENVEQIVVLDNCDSPHAGTPVSVKVIPATNMTEMRAFTEGIRATKAAAICLMRDDEMPFARDHMHKAVTHLTRSFTKSHRMRGVVCFHPLQAVAGTAHCAKAWVA